MSIVPISRPKQVEEVTDAILKKAGITEAVALLGMRGYYRDSMGMVGRNDRGIYDDAIFILSPTVYAGYNANTDPSVVFRKGLAVLKPGLYYYRKGDHDGPKSPPYPALRQASNVTVVRDGIGEQTDNLKRNIRFGINIHKGAYKNTSSDGCQTIYPTQWQSFQYLIYGEMDRHKIKLLPYLLIEKQG